MNILPSFKNKNEIKTFQIVHRYFVLDTIQMLFIIQTNDIINEK